MVGQIELGMKQRQGEVDILMAEDGGWNELWLTKHLRQVLLDRNQDLWSTISLDLTMFPALYWCLPVMSPRCGLSDHSP